MPVDVVRRFQWHGPGSNGDILRFIPPEAPDLVTCFNVAQHYGKADQRKMADCLSKSLRPGGLLLTNQRANLNPEFILELERRLSPGVVLEEIPLVGNSSEKLLAFHHGGKSSAGGVILLR
ncbi:MAG: class I SAM-dependent methyltransferase [Candidatus Micrarchaeota archaeon]|nr:class I SAM-dependent methyltransferase [Candidatus Micrarchaeota archaeon]